MLQSHWPQPSTVSSAALPSLSIVLGDLVELPRCAAAAPILNTQAGLSLCAEIVALEAGEPPAEELLSRGAEVLLGSIALIDESTSSSRPLSMCISLQGSMPGHQVSPPLACLTSDHAAFREAPCLQVFCWEGMFSRAAKFSRYRQDPNGELLPLEAVLPDSMRTVRMPPPDAGLSS